MADGITAAARRRSIVAAAVAVLVVAAALLAVLLLGRAEPPAFPSLTASPDPSIPGRVAFATAGGDATCLAVVDAGGGQPRTLHCVQDLFATDVSWRSAGEAVLRGHDRLGALELSVDPAQGRVLARKRIPPGAEPPARPEPAGCPMAGDERADGAYVVTTQASAPRAGEELATGVVLVEPDGGERPLVSVEDSSGYAFVCAAFSPDGRWVLVRDTADRLLVLDARAGGARVLAAGATAAAWQPAS